jgi:hypothetical protein
VLAVFALKKAWPEKYDDRSPVVNIDARSISAELAQIGPVNTGVRPATRIPSRLGNAAEEV